VSWQEHNLAAWIRFWLACGMFGAMLGYALVPPSASAQPRDRCECVIEITTETDRAR